MLFFSFFFTKHPERPSGTCGPRPLSDRSDSITKEDLNTCGPWTDPSFSSAVSESHLQIETIAPSRIASGCRNRRGWAAFGLLLGAHTGLGEVPVSAASRMHDRPSALQPRPLFIPPALDLHRAASALRPQPPSHTAVAVDTKMPGVILEQLQAHSPRTLTAVKALNGAETSQPGLSYTCAVWSGESDADLDAAAEALSRGEPVAFPTETVYGLGALAADDSAVKKIFKAKGRPSDNPLIVHFADGHAGLRLIAADGLVPPEASALAEAFWPGPLSICIQANAAAVCTTCRAGLDTVAVRVPDHAVALRILRALDAKMGAPTGVALHLPSILMQPS